MQSISKYSREKTILTDDYQREWSMGIWAVFNKKMDPLYSKIITKIEGEQARKREVVELNSFCHILNEIIKSTGFSDIKGWILFGKILWENFYKKATKSRTYASCISDFIKWSGEIYMSVPVFSINQELNYFKYLAKDEKNDYKTTLEVINKLSYTLYGEDIKNDDSNINGQDLSVRGVMKHIHPKGIMFCKDHASAYEGFVQLFHKKNHSGKFIICKAPRNIIDNNIRLSKAKQSAKPHLGADTITECNKGLNDTIRCLLANANGAWAKRKSIESICAQENPDLFFMVETKTEVRKCEPEGYKYEYKKRSTSKKKGGGIGVLIKLELINSTEILWEHGFDNFMGIRIKCNGRNVMFAIIYAPCDNQPIHMRKQFFEDVVNTIKKLQDTCDDIVVIGDFNSYLMYNVGEIVQSKLNKNSPLFIDMMNDLDLVDNYKNEDSTLNYTFEKSEKSNVKSIVDYVLSGSGNHCDVTNVIVHDRDSHMTLRNIAKRPSDHNTISFNVENVGLERDRQKKKIKIINRKYNRQDVNNELHKFIFDPEKDKLDQYTNFINAIREQNDKLSKEVFVKVNKQYKNSTNVLKTKRNIKLIKNSLSKWINRLKNEKKITNKNNFSKNKIKICDDKIEFFKKKIENEKQKLKEAKVLLNKHISNDITKKLAEKANELEAEGVRSNCFWKTAKKLKRKSEAPDVPFTINPDGEKIFEEKPFKENICRYYKKTLVERTEGYEDLQDWCNFIKGFNEEKIREWKNHPPVKFTFIEVKRIIKSLLNNKALGIDGISNEILKVLDDQNIRTLTAILNGLYLENLIPPDWNIGIITPIYKNKGKKGDPANYRPIAVNSNIVKIVEKLMYNRMIGHIEITQLQGGGKKRSSTRDYLFILNSLMKKFRGKNFHLVFLDVEKAFDKCWRDLAMFVLSERGCPNREWVYLNLLNMGNKVQVKTYHGLTEEIEIDRVIKQGAVLSPLQYGLLIDEIAKILLNEGKGVILQNLNIPCLLWVDDVALAGESYEEIQYMLDRVYELAREFKIVFGMDKTKHMILGKDPDPGKNLLLGDKVIEKVESYKYLGVMVNSNTDLTDHVTMIQGKINGAISSIANITSDQIMGKIEVGAIMELVNCTINAILAYGTEPFVILKREMTRLKDIQANAIRKLLNINRYAPNIVLLLELGINDIEYEIYKRKILYYKELLLNKKCCGSASKYHKKYVNDALTANNQFKSNMANIMKMFNITLQDLEKPDNVIKSIIKKKSVELMKSDLDTLCRTKLHNKILKHYRDNTRNANSGELVFRATYVEKFTRFGTKNIIESRCKLFPCKDNFNHMNRGKISCRWCKDGTKHETEVHLTRFCLASPIYNTFDPQDFFSNDLTELKKIDKNIKMYYSELRSRGERY